MNESPKYYDHMKAQRRAEMRKTWIGVLCLLIICGTAVVITWLVVR